MAKTYDDAESAEIGTQNPNVILLPKLEPCIENSIYHLFIVVPRNALKEEKGKKEKEE